MGSLGRLPAPVTQGAQGPTLRKALRRRVLKLCRRHFDFLNKFTFEFVFCTWNLMEQRSTRQGLQPRLTGPLAAHDVFCTVHIPSPWRLGQI